MQSWQQELESKNLSLIASAPNAEFLNGGLFTLNAEDKTFKTVDPISSMGLCLIGNDLLVRAFRSQVDGSPSDIAIYDSQGVYKYLRADKLQDPHDIRWDGEHLVAVATLKNRILWFNSSGEIVREYKPPTGAEPLDTWHINCLDVNRLGTFVSAFGEFTEERGWSKQLDQPTGFVFNIESGERVITGLTCPHNPLLLEDQWFICNSYTKELIVTDLSGKTVKRCVLDGWTRGLQVSDNYLFVGESRPRPNHESISRPELEKPTATVAVLNRHSLEVIDRIPCDTIEIYDLLLTPKPLVEGLKRGFRTNTLRTKEQMYESAFTALGVKPQRLCPSGIPLLQKSCASKIVVESDPISQVNQLHHLTAEVTNLGDTIYHSMYPPYPIFLSYRWFSKSSPEASTYNQVILDGNRTFLHNDGLMPNTPTKLTMDLWTPNQPGKYLLRISLVQEGVSWFDDIDPSYGYREEIEIL